MAEKTGNFNFDFEKLVGIEHRKERLSEGFLKENLLSKNRGRENYFLRPLFF